MSESNGPVRRRRIAGESAPVAPVAPAKKAPVKKGPAKPVAKAPVAKTAAAPKPPVPVKAPKAAKAAKAPKAPKAAEAPRDPGSRPSRRDLLLLVPAALVAIVALVAGVLLVISPPGSGDSAKALDSSRRQASSAAASAAETIFSFRYDALDQHLKASKALMTPAFSRQFDKIAPALTELAPQRKIVVQAVARESAAVPCGDACTAKRSDVLVFVDQARLVGDSKEPTVFANRIKVTMVKSGDGWLVSNIRAL